MLSREIQQKTMICNLEQYMIQKGLNITQLSKEIGVTQNTIRNYVQNRFNRIDCDVAVKLCNYFHVSVGEMFQIVEGK